MPSTGQIILPQFNSGGNWDEKLITPESGKVLGFDASLNPVQLSKQDTLVSGTNIKTVNNESLLGSGNIQISGGGMQYTIYNQSSYSIDGANGTMFYFPATTSGTFTLSNITAGIPYSIIVKNNSAGNITITLPTSGTHYGVTLLKTITLSPSNITEYSFLLVDTFYIWHISPLIGLIT